MNGLNYVKIPLNIENNDKYCFIWSMLASVHPCRNIHPNRVSNYKKYFNKLNFQGSDFTKAFKCGDVHRFNKLNNLSNNVLELVLYQDHNKRRHKLIPV